MSLGPAFRPSHSPIARLLLAGAAVGLLASSVLAQGGAQPVQPGGNRNGGFNGGPGGGPGGGFPGGMGRGFMGGLRDMMSPTYTAEMVERYAQMLSLTPEQRDTIKELLEDYQDKFKSEAQDAQEKARKAVQDAQDSGDMMAGMRGAMAPIQDFRNTAAKLDQGFASQFKGVLTPQQAAQWPAVERAQRRDRASSGANFGANVLGERMDLVQIVAKLNINEETRQALAPVLKQYELELDKQLIERNKVSDQAAADMVAARGGDMTQMRDAIQAIMANMRDAGFKVAEVNRRYAEKIRTMLPEDRRPTFARAVKEAKFTDIYRASDGAHAIDAALAFEDLDADQKARLLALKEKYAKDVASVNDRLAVATEQNEVARATAGTSGRGPGTGPGGPGGGRGQGGNPNGNQGGNQNGNRNGRGPGANQGSPPGNANGGNGFPGRSGPMADLMREKRTLDQNTVESLKTILTPEQQAKLPRTQRGPGGGPGGFGPAGPGGGNQPAPRGG